MPDNPTDDINAVCLGESAFGDSDSDGLCDCNSIQHVSDNFDDDALGPAWQDAYSLGGANHFELAGELRLEVPADATEDAYAGISTLRRFFDGEFTISVAARSMPTGVPALETYFEVEGEERAQIRVLQDNIEFRADNGSGSYALVDSAPYDEVAHRHWRLRREQGIVYGETSSDQSTWSSLGQAPATTSPVSIELGSGAYETIPEARVAIFDNLFASEQPITQTGQVVPCYLRTLADDFNDLTLDGRWDSSEGESSAVTESADGTLTFSLQPDADNDSDYPTIRTQQDFRWVDSRVAVELVDSPADLELPVNADLVLRSGDARARIGRVGNGLRANLETDVVQSLGDANFDPALHRFLAIREQGGTIYFEYSSNGTDWTTLGQTSRPQELGNVKVRIYGGRYGAINDAAIFKFDNLTVTPIDE